MATLKYDAKIITSDKTIDNGISLFGFFASSPVVATQSKPTKPKKHLAAPVMTPAKPQGMKPPSPALALYSSGISSGFIRQFAGSPRETRKHEKHYVIRYDDYIDSRHIRTLDKEKRKGNIHYIFICLIPYIMSRSRQLIPQQSASFALPNLRDSIYVRLMTSLLLTTLL